MEVRPSEIERLRRLGEALGQDLLGAIVASFRKSAPKLLDQLGRALSEERLDEARQLVHTLRGSAATFGADRLLERCGELQKKVRAGDAVAGLAVLDEARETLLRVLDELRGEVAKGDVADDA